MTWLDSAIIIIILISTIYSLYRGLVKEFFSFAALLGAYLAAGRFYYPVKEFIKKLLHIDVPGWSIYLLMFIISTIICLYMEKAIKQIIRISITLKLVDSIGGALIGFFKGALVLSLLMLPLHSCSITRPILEKSTTPPYLLEGFKFIKVVSPANIIDSYEKGVESIKKSVNKGIDSVRETASNKKEDMSPKSTEKDENISASDKKKLDDLLKKELDK